MTKISDSAAGVFGNSTSISTSISCVPIKHTWLQLNYLFTDVELDEMNRERKEQIEKRLNKK